MNPICLFCNVTTRTLIDPGNAGYLVLELIADFVVYVYCDRVSAW